MTPAAASFCRHAWMQTEHIYVLIAERIPAILAPPCPPLTTPAPPCPPLTTPASPRVPIGQFILLDNENYCRCDCSSCVWDPGFLWLPFVRAALRSSACPVSCAVFMGRKKNPTRSSLDLLLTSRAPSREQGERPRRCPPRRRFLSHSSSSCSATEPGESP
jgi:hypothetical protein